jgi:hypothetical protein
MIVINIEKAKGIAHDIRRAKRAEEFAPYDEVIMKQIPDANATEAEASRQAIRDKYATIQTKIDATANVESLTTLVSEL